MKKFICTLCMMSLLLSSASALSPADASAEPAPNVVDQKLALMEYAEEYMAAHPQTRSQVLTPEEEMDLIIECEKQNLSYAEKGEVLNPVGVFQLNCNVVNNPVSDPVPFAESFSASEIQMNTPSVYYSVNSNEWSVTGSGKWLINNPWSRHYQSAGFIAPDDAVGVVFTEVSGTTPTRKGGSAWQDNGTSAYENSSTSLLSSNNRTGYAFAIKDEKVATGSFSTTSIGQNFGAVVRYDSTFASFSGKAASFYVHTWDNGNISSITLGVQGGNWGGSIQIAFKDSSDVVKAMSSGQLSF